MRFVDVLSVLSKSSPYAVSTERKDAISAELDAVKKYLNNQSPKRVIVVPNRIINVVC